MQLEEFTSHLHTVYSPLNRKWLLLFPEGGFRYKRLQSSQELVGPFCDDSYKKDRSCYFQLIVQLAFGSLYCDSQTNGLCLIQQNITDILEEYCLILEFKLCDHEENVTSTDVP